MKLTKQPILPGFENGLYERRPVFDKSELEQDNLRRDPVRRGNHVNVRLSTDNLEQLQKLSLEEGVPLPSLIASIVRKYLAGSLVNNETVGNQHLAALKGTVGKDTRQSAKSSKTRSSDADPG